MTANRPIPFKPDPGIREALEDLRAKNDRSISWLVNHLLRGALEGLGYSIPQRFPDATITTETPISAAIQSRPH